MKYVKARFLCDDGLIRLLPSDVLETSQVCEWVENGSGGFPSEKPWIPVESAVNSDQKFAFKHKESGQIILFNIIGAGNNKNNLLSKRSRRLPNRLKSGTGAVPAYVAAASRDSSSVKTQRSTTSSVRRKLGCSNAGRNSMLLVSKMGQKKETPGFQSVSHYMAVKHRVSGGCSSNSGKTNVPHKGMLFADVENIDPRFSHCSQETVNVTLSDDDSQFLQKSSQHTLQPLDPPFMLSKSKHPSTESEKERLKTYSASFDHHEQEIEREQTEEEMRNKKWEEAQAARSLQLEQKRKAFEAQHHQLRLQWEQDQERAQREAAEKEATEQLVRQQWEQDQERARRKAEKEAREQLERQQWEQERAQREAAEKEATTEQLVRQQWEQDQERAWREAAEKEATEQLVRQQWEQDQERAQREAAEKEAREQLERQQWEQERAQREAAEKEAREQWEQDQERARREAAEKEATEQWQRQDREEIEAQRLSDGDPRMQWEQLKGQAQQEGAQKEAAEQVQMQQWEVGQGDNRCRQYMEGPHSNQFGNYNPFMAAIEALNETIKGLREDTRRTQQAMQEQQQLHLQQLEQQRQQLQQQQINQARPVQPHLVGPQLGAAAQQPGEVVFSTENYLTAMNYSRANGRMKFICEKLFGAEDLNRYYISSILGYRSPTHAVLVGIHLLVQRIVNDRNTLNVRVGLPEETPPTLMQLKDQMSKVFSKARSTNGVPEPEAVAEVQHIAIIGGAPENPQEGDENPVHQPHAEAN